MIRWVFLFVLATAGHAQDLTAPKHVDAAHTLVASLDASRTQYRHGEQVVLWKENDRPAEARCDCSGLLNALLTRAYEYGEQDYRKWFGAKRPLAAHYHDAIAKEIGFTRVREVESIHPGDILAVKYEQLAADKSTGHVMLVIESPKPMTAKKPLVDGTDQWRVTIIDSTKSPHGKGDSRVSDDGTKRDGVGRSDFRLYADTRGDVIGYAWSTSTGSTFRERATHSIVVGRLIAGFKP
jgi:hypothetical protein